MTPICQHVDGNDRDFSAGGDFADCGCSWPDPDGVWSVMVDEDGVAWTMFDQFQEMPF